VAQGTFGLSPADVLVFAIVANVTAATGAVVGGVLDDHVGPKAVIVGSLIGLVVTATVLLFLVDKSAFWVCGLLLSLFRRPGSVGLTQLSGPFGPTWAGG
jgi:MFS transporter, UMF1 family